MYQHDINNTKISSERSDCKLKLRKFKLESLIKKKRDEIVQEKLKALQSTAYEINIDTLKLTSEILNMEHSDNLLEYLTFIKKLLISKSLDEVKYGVYLFKQLSISDKLTDSNIKDISSSQMIIFLIESIDSYPKEYDLVYDVLFCFINITASQDSDELKIYFGSRKTFGIYEKTIAKFIECCFQFRIDSSGYDTVKIATSEKLFKIYKQLAICCLNIVANICTNYVIFQDVYSSSLKNLIYTIFNNFKHDKELINEISHVLSNFSKNSKNIKSADSQFITSMILEINPDKDNITEILWSLHFLVNLNDPNIYHMIVNSNNMDTYTQFCYKNEGSLEIYLIYPFLNILASISTSSIPMDNIISSEKIFVIFTKVLENNIFAELYFYIWITLGNFSLELPRIRLKILNSGVFNYAFTRLTSNPISLIKESIEISLMLGSMVTSDSIDDVITQVYIELYSFNLVEKIIDTLNHITPETHKELYIIVDNLVNVLKQYIIQGDKLSVVSINSKNPFLNQFFACNGIDTLNRLKLYIKDEAVLSTIKMFEVLFSNR